VAPTPIERGRTDVSWRTAAPAALLAALALAGCGGGGSDSAAPATTPASSPAATTPTATPGRAGGALTSPPAAGAGSAGELPAGFPLPPGASVGPVAVTGDEITATLTVPDGKQVYDFWRSRLPAAGYRVTGAQMVGGIGEISFTGRDCTGDSQLGINDDRVTFECKRG
jgi:hypothetical protein